MALIFAFPIIAFHLSALPFLLQIQGGTQQAAGLTMDFAEDLRKPGTAAVLGTITKYTESKRERISEKEADLGEMGNFAKMSGTIYYKAEAQAELAISESFCGDAKGKSVAAAFTLQLARVLDGSERIQVLSKPKVNFVTPLTGLFVLEREKGKKTFRVARLLRFDAAKETSSDPIATFRKRAQDVYGINRRHADFLDAFDAADALRLKKDLAGAAKKLHEVLDAKKKWQLPESDSAANLRLAPFEKRAKEDLAEIEKLLAPAETKPAAPPEGKPPA
jgi:hypothetical protein